MKKIILLSILSMFWTIPIVLGQSSLSSSGQSGITVQNPPPGTASREYQNNQDQTTNNLAPVVITHSATQNIVANNSVTCNSGTIPVENSLFRDFNLAADFGITDEFNVTSAEFGVENSGGPTNLTINIYSTSTAFPSGYPGSATLQGTASYVSGVADAGTVVSVPITATIPAGEIMIYELKIDAGATVSWFQGSNADGQTGVSWIQAEECDIFTPTDAVDIGFPDMHLVMNVVGEVAGGGGFPDPYCAIDFSTVEPITLVNVADIDNRSSEVIDGSPAHEDFTAIVGNMEAGETYSVALEGNTGGGFTNSFTVFIDWNQDGSLDGADERYDIGTIQGSTGTDGQQATADITVPSGALEGPTRMRVVKKFGSTYPVDSCTGTSWGQAEDYTVNVSASGCTAPEMSAYASDDVGEPIQGCIEAGGEYYVYVTLSGGSGNDTYNVTANNNDPVVVDADSSEVLGPFTVGTDVSLTAVGVQDDGCSVSASVDSPEICEPTGPDNDDCSGAIALSCDDSVAGTTVGATESGLESPTCATGSLEDVFYSLDVTAGTEYTITVQGADYDAVLAIYSGECATLVEIDCADNGFSAGDEETITFTATADETILVRTYDWSVSAGSFTISVTCEQPLPCDDPFNDDAANSDVYISNIDIAGIGIDAGNPDFDFTYTSNSMSPDGYKVVTNPTVTVYPGLQGAYTVSSGPAGNSDQYYYSVWIDFNQDGCFDSGEQIIWSNDVIWGGGVPNGEPGVTEVPMAWEGIAPGTYQARIRNSMIDHPLAEGNGDGEAIDFTVDVITEADAERLLGIGSQVFSSFTFYPNPVEDQLSLKANTPIEQVEVYNLVGQIVIQEQPNALESNLATDQLQTGVYLMKVTIDGNQKTFRVVKN
ncbi:GEVED domain-containing protein [Aequorivita marina]|uniref:GEVED domain-containing protein n=1 Tax=Aequorivita marina TaxID=3073654 RepID=UPI002876B174|nr:GEVED domain-containing protein [Aequorivita sp. S2608]MDS1296798.1 GEVED domain-containing protein [Aequorivita sp. S2608]